jgi:predicted nucleic acid-binding protein
MSRTVVDSSVAAKWVLPEADSAQALRLVSEVALAGGQLIMLDLAMTEITNAIWKRLHRGLASPAEARQSALEIASRYGRSIYDALFVALAQELDLPGVTADEPLYRAVHADFPRIVLLRNW